MTSPSIPRRRSLSPPTSVGQRSPPAQRQCASTGKPSPEGPHDGAGVVNSHAARAANIELLPDFVPSALKLVEAMKRVHRLDAIGYCPTKNREMSKHMIRYGPKGLTPDDVEMHQALTEDMRQREQHNTAIVAKIGEIYSQHANNLASGYLDKPFHLRIRKAGCEYDGAINPPTKFSNFHHRLNYMFEETEATEALLKSWYRSADASGYGDVREQVTKIDKAVRRAREIPASDFEVEPELTTRIAELWDAHFYPNNGVRIEPYKIHLYGPKDHFRQHRDTPQKDLVGTFLLGLGDTSYGGGLVVDGEDMPAHGGHWCAFYPDVPHAVKEVWSGYRAVIAFKIFRDNSSQVDTPTSSQVRTQVSDLVRQLQAPFGLMLERKYCLGTEHFSGFDALVYESVLGLDGVDARHLPVVLTSRCEWGSEDDRDCHRDYQMSCDTNVYPFTRGHMEAVGDPYDAHTDHASCGCPWLKGVKVVPFFSFDLSRSLLPYSSEEQETCNYVGNEAQAWRDDSVYLSYALLVLPDGFSTADGANKKGDNSSSPQNSSEEDCGDAEEEEGEQE